MNTVGSAQDAFEGKKEGFSRGNQRQGGEHSKDIETYYWQDVNAPIFLND